MCWSEEQCLKENRMVILRRAKVNVRAMCGLRVKHGKSAEDLMLMLGFD